MNQREVLRTGSEQLKGRHQPHPGTFKWRGHHKSFCKPEKTPTRERVNCKLALNLESTVTAAR